MENNIGLFKFHDRFFFACPPPKNLATTPSCVLIAPSPYLLFWVFFSGAKTFVFSATNQKWMTKSPSDWLMTSVVSERTSWKALGEKKCLVIRSNSAFQIQISLKVGKTSSEILIQVFDFPAKSERNICTQIWLSSEILSFITAPRTKKCYLRKTK